MNGQALTDEIGRSAMSKALWRILPLVALAYLCAYTDRVNVSFAATRMNADLGFSATVYGLGGGLFFLGYALLEVPSNLMLVRFGARRWLARIMVTWGLLSAGMMFVNTPVQFYLMRFLLGVAEAGFYPGVIYYFAGWFPPCHRGRAISRFYVAGPLTSIVLGSVSASLLALDGLAGLKGWQWLFVAQGLPSVVVGLILLRFLPDAPDKVVWLTRAEKDWIAEALAREQARIGPSSGHSLLAALRNPRVVQFGLYGMLLIGVQASVILSAPLMLISATGLDVETVGWIVSAGGLIGVVVMLWLGNSADRRNARLSDGVVFSVALAVSVLVMALSLRLSPAILVAAYFGFAATCFTIPMLTSSAWTDVLPARELAVGAAAINTLSQTGAFFTPFAWGALKDVTGDYRAGLFMLSAMSVVFSMLLYWISGRVNRPSSTLLEA
jgi:MFS transporter, ACS family, tartrate transporter